MSLTSGTTVSRWERVRLPLGAAAGIGLASLALRLRDPHQHASWGLCPFKALTGWDCPGCGGLRAVNDLTHGEVSAAWHSNALFVSLIPVLVGLWVLWFARGWADNARPLTRRTANYVAVGLGVLLLAFTVFRNLPAGSAFYAS